MTDRTASEGVSASPTSASTASEVSAAKATLRAEMRALRLGLPDRAARSETLWRHVIDLPALVDAESVLAFASIPGEPETQPFHVWCAATGRMVTVPEADVDPAWPDVVVVPGLSFTARGERLGQGGGWYDRFLSGIRPDCTSIGVCFAEQLLDDVPIEPHDVLVDHVVTDEGVVR